MLLHSAAFSKTASLKCNTGPDLHFTTFNQKRIRSFSFYVEMRGEHLYVVADPVESLNQ